MTAVIRAFVTRAFVIRAFVTFVHVRGQMSTKNQRKIIKKIIKRIKTLTSSLRRNINLAV